VENVAGHIAAAAINRVSPRRIEALVVGRDFSIGSRSAKGLHGVGATCELGTADAHLPRSASNRRHAA